MPNKTIYISDNDLPTAEAAAELCGGLSAAAVEGMKLLMERNKAHANGFQEVHVTDTSTGVQHRKIFQGRQLAQLEQSFSGTRTVWTTYLTPKDNIAVVRTTLPDIVGVATHATQPRKDGENVAASNKTGNFDALADKLGDLLNLTLPLASDSPLNKIGADKVSKVQRLTRDIDLEWINNPWKFFDYLNPREAQDNHSTQGFSDAIPVDSEREDNTPTNKGNETAESLPAHQQSPSDRWQASSTLEVFQSPSDLREAAFRQLDDAGALGAIPATLIAATERGMDGGGVEYLDI